MASSCGVSDICTESVLGGGFSCSRGTVTTIFWCSSLGAGQHAAGVAPGAAVWTLLRMHYYGRHLCLCQLSTTLPYLHRRDVQPAAPLRQLSCSSRFQTKQLLHFCLAVPLKVCGRLDTICNGKMEERHRFKSFCGGQWPSGCHVSNGRTACHSCARHLWCPAAAAGRRLLMAP